eukprot:scaffold68538_cov29-Tisochrysis_lutea.AAC.4
MFFRGFRCAELRRCCRKLCRCIADREGGGAAMGGRNHAYSESTQEATDPSDGGDGWPLLMGLHADALAIEIAAVPSKLSTASSGRSGASSSCCAE